ncbi:MAG TPA: ribbon-helix-helix domain-containing protein [Candidatus Nanoarchaeia archaeon]|nr:ribbon-helix-helix domain-containing protein [Candidatus Nanoarchaeia archaeon]
MKHKMSITIDEDLVHKILQRRAENRLFQSKSQVIAEALRCYFEGEE